MKIRWCVCTVLVLYIRKTCPRCPSAKAKGLWLRTVTSYNSRHENSHKYTVERQKDTKVLLRVNAFAVMATSAKAEGAQLFFEAKTKRTRTFGLRDSDH